MQKDSQVRTYDRAKSVTFLKTNESFGGLSNMAGGFPLKVNGLHIFTAEALYQACRFPHLPNVQRMIIESASPMTAKMKSKPHRRDSRPDWDQVRVKIMRWSLRVKLAQNWAKFSDLLMATGDRPIVEESRKDDFWGAKPIDENMLVGTNVLGRLLMELREAVKSDKHDSLLRVEPLAIPDFSLDGRPIATVSADDVVERAIIPPSIQRRARVAATTMDATQPSLFEQSLVKEVPAPYTASGDAQVPIADLEPYPAMKNSGVPWLGEVPEHWCLQRTKTILRERVQKGFPDEPLLAATQTKGVVRKEEYENRTVLALKDLHLLKLVRVGDFVISLRSFQGGIEYARQQGIISPAYTVLYATDPDMHGFLGELFKSKPYVENLSLYVTGIRQGQNIDYEKLSRSELPLPPLPEQAAIERFINHADQRIRRYIRAKQKLIKLLEEQKQAIIHRAVTRGLDPNIRLKPSGVEWLGDVPEHWEVWQIGHFSKVGNGSTPSRGNPAYWAGGHYPWLNSAYANQESVTQADQFVTDTALRECHLPIVPPASVLMAITGQGKTRGKATVLRIEATINQHIAYITPREEIASADYLCLALRGAYAQLRSISDDSGSTKGALTCADINHFRLALPSVSEQAAIVAFVEADTHTCSVAIDRTNREISLLREYRTRLIADVVTGKLDVREAAAKLPDGADEPEAKDDADALAEGDESPVDEMDAAPEDAEA